MGILSKYFNSASKSKTTIQATQSDQKFKFIKYDGSDEVCQITAVFKQGEPLVICENWGLVKYESSSVASVKCDEKPWVERRDNKAYKFVQKYQRDVPGLKELIKVDLRRRFVFIYDEDVTFAKFSNNSDAWLESLKIICAQEMKLAEGEFKDNTLLGLFYRNAVFPNGYDKTTSETSSPQNETELGQLDQRRKPKIPPKIPAKSRFVTPIFEHVDSLDSSNKTTIVEPVDLNQLANLEIVDVPESSTSTTITPAIDPVESENSPIVENRKLTMKKAAQQIILMGKVIKKFQSYLHLTPLLYLAEGTYGRVDI